MFATIRTSLRERLAPAAKSVRARVGEHGERDDGFLLIEVVISTVLVALIVIATMTGFDVINRTTADERHHNQAAVLAAQSQEQLRTNPASTLDLLQEAKVHEYTKTVGGTTFTIAQKAEFINGSTGSTGCTSENGKTGAGLYVQVSSTVTWPQLSATKRPKVSQSSIITPPDGSTLEVDVQGEQATELVSGAKVAVEYVGNEAELPTNIEQKTGAQGCALFVAIPATSATVEVSKPNFVTPSGAFVFGPKEASIAPNITTHEHVELGEAGAIEVQYTYGTEKKTEAEWEKDGKKEPVEGDTFVAYNHLMSVAPMFEVGSSEMKVESSGAFEAKTGKYAAAAKTAVSPEHYANGDLFPFKSSWAVYAGDCIADAVPAALAKEKIEAASALVNVKATTKVAVPMSYVRLTVNSGTTASHKVETKPMAVKITNVGCAASAAPNNSTKLAIVHENKTNAEGHLEYPFQPFGKFELCVYSSTEKKKYVAKYATETVKGPAELNIYLKETATEKKGTNTAITVSEGSC